MFFNKKAVPDLTKQLIISVELEGVEPSSKQAAKMVSTCLAFG